MDVLLPGGDELLHAVGESYHHEALRAIAGPADGKSHTVWAWALLHHEAGNPHDANAVAVVVGGQRVAYLSKDDAALVAPALDQLLTQYGARSWCPAKISGGGMRKGADGRMVESHFSVKLEVKAPAATSGPWQTTTLTAAELAVDPPHGRQRRK